MVYVNAYINKYRQQSQQHHLVQARAQLEATLR